MIYPDKKILNLLNNTRIPSSFGVFEDGEETDEFVDSFINFYKENNFKLFHGMSKAVLFFEDKPYVIKIPFNGCYYYDYDKNKNFEKFHNANSLTYEESWDYCEDELNKYYIAESEGFEHFFAKTGFLGNFNNYPFYIQEKVIPLNENERTLNYSKISKEKCDNSKQCKYSGIDKNWLSVAIDHYGLNKVENFLSFAAKNDLLNDMHEGNLGFSLDEKPVFLDWSGWND